MTQELFELIYEDVDSTYCHECKAEVLVLDARLITTPTGDLAAELILTCEHTFIAK